jgi:hypothetical protein
MEQIIHTRERILNPEFLLENALSLFGPQRANAVRLGGVSQEPFLERSFFCRRQVWGPTGLSLGDDRCKTVIAIPIDPPLHESSAAAWRLCDRWGIVTFTGQKNGSIAISLFGISLLTSLLTQLRQILRVVKLDLHLTDPLVFARVCHTDSEKFSRAR